MVRIWVNAERESITVVGAEPQRGPGTDPGVRRAKPHEMHLHNQRSRHIRTKICFFAEQKFGRTFWGHMPLVPWICH